MNSASKAMIGLAIGAAIVTTSAPAFAADNGDITLRPAAGRFAGSPEKYVGGGSAAKAYRNDDGSYTLNKVASTETNAYAALIVEGVQGERLDSLEQFSFDVVSGHVGGGSPRMNLYWDNHDGGSTYDGYALVGGASAIIAGHFTVDPSAAQTFSGANPVPDATVSSLSILVDEQGLTVIDNVVLDELTLR